MICYIMEREAEVWPRLSHPQAPGGAGSPVDMPLSGLGWKSGQGPGFWIPRKTCVCLLREQTAHRVVGTVKSLGDLAQMSGSLLLDLWLPRGAVHTDHPGGLQVGQRL